MLKLIAAVWALLMLRKVLETLRKILETLERIEKGQTPSLPTQIVFFTIVDGIKTKVNHMNMKVTQNLPLSIEIKDKFGNAANVDGKPEWSATAPDLVDLEVSEDGMSAIVKPKGSIGELAIQVSADADLGEGVKSIMGELPLSLLSGDAESISIAAGAPTDA